MRRFIVAGALAIAMLAGGATYAPGVAAASEESKTKAPKKVSIAIIGDSMARSYCRGLGHFERSMKSVEFLCWTKPSTGLTRIDYYDWADALTEKLEESVPDAAIVSMGANDAQRMVLNKNILEFAEPRWTEAYSSRVARFITALTAKGTRVFWVGMPIARSARYSKRMSHLNKIYSDNVNGKSQTFLPLWSLTQDKNGKFTRSMKDLRRADKRVARATDGIHFTGHGELIVSCHLLQKILPELKVDERPKRCGGSKK